MAQAIVYYFYSSKELHIRFISAQLAATYRGNGLFEKRRDLITWRGKYFVDHL